MRPALADSTPYRALETQVNGFASGLAWLGVTRGERVAVLSHNRPALVPAWLGLEPERVREALRERLASYKVPRVIWLVDALTHIEHDNPWRSPDELDRLTPSRDAR